MKYPDYYLFNITDSDHPDDHPPFEIYLEGGRYTIETEAGKLFKYPKIITDSKIQNDLSDYYILSDKLMSIAKENARKLNEEVSKKK